VLVVDLFEDLRDGFNLLTLLEVLSHQTFVRHLCYFLIVYYLLASLQLIMHVWPVYTLKPV